MTIRNRQAPLLPAAIADRVAGFPPEWQAALARLIEDIGESGLHLIVCALTAKPAGRPSYELHTESLLFEMAALRAIHSEWTLHRLACGVVASPAGKAECERSGCQPDSLRRRLLSAWSKRGARILREASRADGEAWWKYLRIMAAGCAAQRAREKERSESATPGDRT